MKAKAEQAAKISFWTANKNVKVNMSLHYYEGKNRFYCVLSRNEDKSEPDVNSMSSPIEFKYCERNRVSKFYAFFRFDTDCTLNLIVKVDIVPPKRKVVRKPPPPIKTHAEKNEEYLEAKFSHKHLIADLEKMDILPQRLIQEDQLMKKNSVLKRNIRISSAYRDYKSFKMLNNRSVYSERAQSALIKKREHLHDKKEDIETQELRRQMKQFYHNTKQAYHQFQRNSKIWMLFITYYSVIHEIKAAFDKKVAYIDHHSDYCRKALLHFKQKKEKEIALKNRRAKLSPKELKEELEEEKKDREELILLGKNPDADTYYDEMFKKGSVLQM